MTDLPTTPEFFARNGPMAQVLGEDIYEPRRQQVDMAKAVCRIVEAGGVLVSEAPCGVGKSLSYSQPAVTWALQNSSAKGKKKVLIATANIALQSQLVKKDLPMLAEALTGEDRKQPFCVAVFKGRSNYACLAGNTEVVTWDGLRKIKELAGSTQKIVDGNGKWVTSEFFGAGRQETVEISMHCGRRKKVIRATLDHEWIVQLQRDSAQTERKETSDLQPGDLLIRARPKPVAKQLRPSPTGIARGIVFGNGTVFGETIGGWRTATIVLHDEKVELQKYFPLHETKFQDLVSQGYAKDGLRVCDLPVYYKSLPPLDEAPSYLYGWLAGYVAADGTVNKRGQIYLASAKKRNLEFVQALCIRLGIEFGQITPSERIGINQTEPSFVYQLSINASTLTPEFFLRQKHKLRGAGKRRYPRRLRSPWVVDNVARIRVCEDVFCAQVDTTSSFVLEGNVLTGNCKFKLHDDREGMGMAAKADMIIYLEDMLEWDMRTRTGDKVDIEGFTLPEHLWPSYSSTSDECLGTGCPRMRECWANKARVEAHKADVIVTNHMMLALSTELPELFPQRDILIVDEAHELEDWFRKALGWEIGSRVFKLLSTSVKLLEIDHHVGREVLRGLEADSRALFDDLLNVLGNQDRVRLMSTPGNLLGFDGLVDGLAEVQGKMKVAHSKYFLKEDPTSHRSVQAKKAERIAKRAGELLVHLRQALDEFPEEYVFWLERKQLKGKSIHYARLCSAPISVADKARGVLNSFHAAVLTSATLQVAGNFRHLQASLGISSGSKELALTSPFDLATHCAVIFPTSMPRIEKHSTEQDRKEAEEEYRQHVGRHIEYLIKTLGGGVLGLFSSRASLEITLKRMEDRNVAERLGVKIYHQGQIDRMELIKRFKRDENSVLLGLASFWQGVDVPGQSLRCVVIDKMPFAPFGDPVESAIGDYLKTCGGNPFAHRILPKTLLALKQGAGRLIRTSSDYGLIVILDRRAEKGGSGYWKAVDQSLPPCRRYASIKKAPEILEAMREGKRLP